MLSERQLVLISEASAAVARHKSGLDRLDHPRFLAAQGEALDVLLRLDALGFGVVRKPDSAEGAA